MAREKSSPVPVDRPFGRRELKTAQGEILHEGKWGNALVRRLCIGGREWTVKDIAHTALLHRETIGISLLRRELRAMQILDGAEGVPRDAFRIDRYAMAYAYVEGDTLKTLKRRKVAPPPAFFEQFSVFVNRMHGQGIVHLDLRNARNVVVTGDWQPVFLDFQTAMRTRRMPRALCNVLRECDRSAVRKWWLKLSPDTCPSETRQKLVAFNRLRRLWVFRGYSFLHLRKKRRLGLDA